MVEKVVEVEIGGKKHELTIIPKYDEAHLQPV